MRRAKAEIKDRDALLDVFKCGKVCRLGMIDEEGYPYIVPLNYVYEVDGDKIVLYFHSALEGKKMDILKANDKVGFEIDCDHELVYMPEKQNCTYRYRSLMGRGRIAFIDDEDEKVSVLKTMMRQYHGKDLPFNLEAVKITAVYKMEVESFTGKMR